MSGPTRIYMDNAATSFPKPPEVLAAMTHYATELGASPGRGAYAEAREAGQMLYDCRVRINQLIGGENPDHVIFTLNTSDALNMGLRGLLRPHRPTPDHVITTALDHNSILRPLNMLVERDGIEQTVVPCDPQTGLVDPDAIRQAVRPNTRLIAVVHGSNVSGTLQPVRAIGRIARELAVPLLVDAAQTLGHYPLDVQEDFIDLLAAPGHKGLLGPLGTGILYIRPGLEKMMRTSREGGTGSRSDLAIQPEFLPDRFEPGSHNAIGILGLSEGVRYILEAGIENLWAHERGLMQRFIDRLGPGRGPAGLRYLGPEGIEDRCAVFSIRIEGFEDPVILAETLEDEFGLLTRAGIHCAPLAHQTFGTLNRGGTTRFSFGPFTTDEQVDTACSALMELALRAQTLLA